MTHAPLTLAVRMLVVNRPQQLDTWVARDLDIDRAVLRTALGHLAQRGIIEAAIPAGVLDWPWVTRHADVEDMLAQHLAAVGLPFLISIEGYIAAAQRDFMPEPEAEAFARRMNDLASEHSGPRDEERTVSLRDDRREWQIRGLGSAELFAELDRITGDTGLAFDRLTVSMQAVRPHPEGGAGELLYLEITRPTPAP